MSPDSSAIEPTTKNTPILRGTLTARHGTDRIQYQIKPDLIWGRQPADVLCLSWPDRAGLIPLGARVDFVVRSRPPGAAHLVDIVGVWGWEGPAGGGFVEWRAVGSYDLATKSYFD